MNYHDKREELFKKLLEIATLLDEMSELVETAPEQIYGSFGLFANSPYEWDEEAEKGALTEWKLKIKNIGFLLHEITSRDSNALSDMARKYDMKWMNYEMQLEEVGDKNSPEYKKIKEEQNKISNIKYKADFAFESYMVGCLNEFAKLIKQFWWDI